MKKLVILLLVVLVGLVLAQGLLKADSDGIFTPITFDTRGVTGSTPDLSIAEVKLSSGVSCFFMTPARNALELRTLDSIVGLGCVK